MAKSQQSFDKKEKEKKRLKKRKEKAEKKLERQENSKGGGLDNMMAYIDEDGNITDTPPDPTKKKKVFKASDIELGIPKKEEEDNSDGYEGRVDYFDDSKGFGFIIDAKTSMKYFVHVSGTTEEIKEGNKVRFDLEKGMKGMNAVNVSIVK